MVQYWPLAASQLVPVLTLTHRHWSVFVIVCVCVCCFLFCFVLFCFVLFCFFSTYSGTTSNQNKHIAYYKHSVIVECFLFPGPHWWQNKEIYICILTCFLHIYKHFSDSPCIYYAQHKFILPFLCLKHYHMDHSSLPTPCLLVIFQSDVEHLTSTSYLINC